MKDLFTRTSYDPTDSSVIDANKKQLTQGGRRFDYVQGGTIIRQLCKVFPLGWRFEYDDPQFIPSSVDANGVPSATGTWRTDGRLIITTYGLAIATGATLDAPLSPERAFSDALVLRDIGYCAMPNPSMLETAVKGSFTDALKRCARQLGDQFGNSLYDGGEDDAPTGITAPHAAPVAHAPVRTARPVVPQAIQHADLAEGIACMYCAAIIERDDVVQWCRDKRTLANGTTHYACYACQQREKAAGLGVGMLAA